MSLCILLRDSYGNAVMAADTALTIEWDGITYRVQNHEDTGKIINCNNNLLFISEIYDYAVELREFAKAMDPFNLGELQRTAIKMLDSGKYTPEVKDDVMICACLEDNRAVCMRASNHFEMEYHDAPRGSAMDILTTGAMAEQAFHNAFSFVNDTEWGLPLIARTFNTVLCEEVGGGYNVIQKLPNGRTLELNGRFHEPENIRKITVSITGPTHGKVYASDGVFNGNVFARNGEFNGIVKARDFLLPAGDSMVSILNEKGQIKGNYIDAKGISIVDDNGENVLTIDKTGIHWPQKYSPIKHQYAAYASGPWHTVQQSADKYRRESFDGGTTWGAPYQFRGTDGRPGSDASVTFNNILRALQTASNTKTTFITADEMGAPNIYGGKIYGSVFYGNEYNVYPSDVSKNGSFNIFGAINGNISENPMFKIQYAGAAPAPAVTISTPGATHLYWSAGWTHFRGDTTFYGNADFSLANVTGIHATFA